MLHEPPIDELAEKMGSKYALCVVAQNQGLTDVPGGEKPLTIAAKEIYDKKIIPTKF